MTNHHVLSTPEECRKQVIQFNYQQDYRKKSLETSIFELDPFTYFYTNEEDDLDFTVVAVGKRLSGNHEISEYGFIPMFDEPDKHAKGMFLNIIQHPGGLPKQIVIRDSRLLDRTDNTLIYSSDTEEGSSGSPVFNDEFEVIALHHWREPYKAIRDIEGTDLTLPQYGNEGIRISSIVTNLLENQETMNETGKALISKALSYPFRSPSLIVEEESLIVNNEVSNGQESSPNDNSLKLNSNKIDQVMSTINQNTLEVTIPVTISVRIGEQGVQSNFFTENNTDIHSEEGAEKLKPDFNYGNRKGYNPKFLGVPVPLPVLSKSQVKYVATNLEEADSSEFKYQHFSVVMNKKRKLAFYTSVNIDGGSVVKINRTTGNVTRGPEAREKWYDDNRIDTEEVCHDDLYLDPEMKIFQRGHLVKRTDPSWGTEAKAKKGQADTFHFTNCAPQHALFNPNANKWAGIENWITNTSDNDDVRISVFSGPVFESDDPEVSGFLIPKAYWKVVCWIEEGQLKSAGLLADQSDLLLQSGVGPEAMSGKENLSDVPSKLKEFKCAIKYLEKITGLDFGKLVNADIYSDGSEALGGKEKVEISSFEEIFNKSI